MYRCMYLSYKNNKTNYITLLICYRYLCILFTFGVLFFSYHTVYGQSGFPELDQLGKIFIIFCQISWLKNLILKLYSDHVESAIHKHVSLISILILSLSIFTRNPAALYTVSNISLLYNHTYSSLFFQLT